MNFEVQLGLVRRHAVTHPQPVLKATPDYRLVRLKHLHCSIVHLASCTSLINAYQCISHT